MPKTETITLTPWTDWARVFFDNIALHRIDIVDRERPIDTAKVAAFAESIRREGLLQPIGVRAPEAEGENYRLIYGAHRLEAARLVAKSDPTQDAITVTLFPGTMPDWACKIVELAENLLRAELTTQQHEAQTALYAGLLKKHGLVSGASKVRGRSNPNGSGLKKPTATAKVAADLRITDDTVRNRIKNAVKTAAQVGVKVEHDTPEAMTPDELIQVGEAVQRADEGQRKKALAKPKPAKPKQIDLEDYTVKPKIAPMPDPATVSITPEPRGELTREPVGDLKPATPARHGDWRDWTEWLKRLDAVLAARPDPNLIRDDKDFENVRFDVPVGNVLDLVSETRKLLERLVQRAEKMREGYTCAARRSR